MPRIQLRLWHLMLTIAVVALIVGGLIWRDATIAEVASVSRLTNKRLGKHHRVMVLASSSSGISSSRAIRAAIERLGSR